MNKLQIVFNRIKGLPKHYKRKYDNNALFREDWDTFRGLAPITTYFIICFIIILVLGIQRVTTPTVESLVTTSSMESLERNDMNEVGKENRMTFKVIDTLTGKEPTDRVINDIAKDSTVGVVAKKGGLIITDIDQFFIGEDGHIIEH